jgi:hypothetical protein
VPFEASLSTILFGPERRLAIVDGRIVWGRRRNHAARRSAARRARPAAAVDWREVNLSGRVS